MRKSHKLLAVVTWIGSAQAQADTPRTFENGSPAAGNTMGKTTRKQSQAEYDLGIATARLTKARDDVASKAAEELAWVRDFITTPRRLANGAPACGNTMGKGEEPCTQARADQEQADRLAGMQSAIKQRRIARAREREAARAVAAAKRAFAPRERVALKLVRADVGSRR